MGQVFAVGAAVYVCRVAVVGHDVIAASSERLQHSQASSVRPIVNSSALLQDIVLESFGRASSERS